MKAYKSAVILAFALAASGCQSTFGPQIGMTEKQWLRRTLIADVAYMEGNVKAYRSGGYYYYFRDGVLVKIDQGIIPPQQINMQIRSESNARTSRESDIYEEIRKLDQLRKEGLISDQEFQSRKEKILSR